MNPRIIFSDVHTGPDIFCAREWSNKTNEYHGKVKCVSIITDVEVVESLSYTYETTDPLSYDKKSRKITRLAFGWTWCRIINKNF